MANEIPPVQVAIEAQVTSLVKAAGQASAALEDFAVRSNRALETPRTPARRTGEEIEGLGAKLRKFASDQRSEARTASYFVSEFAAFLPVGSAARETLGSLTAALVGGAGIGLAIEAVTLGIRLLTARAQEAQKRIEAVDRQVGQVTENARRRSQQLADELLRVTRGAPAVQTQEFTRQLQEISFAIAQAQRDVGRAVFKEDEKERLQKLLSQQAQLMRDHDAAVAAERQLAELDLNREIANLRQASMSEVERVASEAEQRIAEARTKYASAGAQKIAELETAIRGAAAAQIAEINRRTADEAFAHFQRQVDEMERKLRELAAFAEAPTESTFGFGTVKKPPATMFPEVDFAGAQFPAADLVAGERAAGGAAMLTEQDRLNAQLVERQRAAGQQLADELVNPMVAAWSDGIGQMIAGQAKLRDVVAQSSAAMLKSIIAVIVKRVQAESVAGQATAISHNAWNPIVAAAAAAAITGMMTGLLAKMPSAAGGWQIPLGVDPMVQAHGGEHVIPRRLARVYEQVAGLVGGAGEGAAGAGAPPPMPPVNAIDAQSFRDFLDRGGMDEWFGAWERWKRDGRA